MIWTKRLNSGFYLLLVVILSVSCYKEYIRYPDPQGEVFNFFMTEEQENQINSSRGIEVIITDPLPDLYYNAVKYKIDHFKTRGESSLNLRRKSLSVNLDRNLNFYIDSEGSSREIEKFKLISLVFDYTYIEHSIAIEVYKKIGLWPTLSFFTEIKINNNSQGLYLFIEDPEDYFLGVQNASFFLRRYYRNAIKSYKINSAGTQSEEFYLNRFNKIYSLLPEYSGTQLFDSLSSLMDMKKYFTKISIDLLLRNGDYTDEVYFYSQNINGNEIFSPFPWDYDDLFSAYPHEVGRAWAVGDKLGQRIYNSINDVNATLKGRLLFSIEDDLDYIIATDDFIYRKYLENLEDIFTTIDYNFIESVFEVTESEIAPFYTNDTIIEQSKYDLDETNKQLFYENLANQKQMLLERINWINQEINIQKTN